PAQGRGEREGREAVQHRLYRQESDVAADTVLYRAEDGEWTDAEDQAARHERLAECRSPLAATRQPPLEIIAQVVQPIGYTHRLTQQPTQQDRAEHDEDILR